MSMVKCEHHARSFSTIADEDGPSFLFEFHCFLWSYPQVSGLDGLKQHRCKTFCMWIQIKNQSKLFVIIVCKRWFLKLEVDEMCHCVDKHVSLTVMDLTRIKSTAL